MRADRVHRFWQAAGSAVFSGNLPDVGHLSVHPMTDGAYLWVVWGVEAPDGAQMLPIVAGGRCRGRTKGTAIAEGVRRLIAMEKVAGKTKVADGR